MTDDKLAHESWRVTSNSVADTISSLEPAGARHLLCGCPDDVAL